MNNLSIQEIISTMKYAFRFIKYILEVIDDSYQECENSNVIRDIEYNYANEVIPKIIEILKQIQLDPYNYVNYFKFLEHASGYIIVLSSVILDTYRDPDVSILVGLSKQLNDINRFALSLINNHEVYKINVFELEEYKNMINYIEYFVSKYSKIFE